MKEKIEKEIERVRILGNEIGYGQLMSLASSLWREKLTNDFKSGALIPTLRSFVNKDPEIEKIVDDDIYFYDEMIKKYK